MKFMKPWLMAAAFAVPTFASAPAIADDTYVLRLTEHGPSRGVRAETYQWFAKEVDERSNGRIKVDVHWGQSLAKAKDAVKAVQSGLADMGTLVSVYAPNEFPIWSLANGPFFFDDEWVAMKTMTEAREVMPLVGQEPATMGLKVLFNLTSGPVQVMTRDKPITSTEDLAGLKIRTFDAYTTLMGQLGATPVQIGFGEVYSALDRGTVDGTVNYVHVVGPMKHHEVASHITEVSMGQMVGWGVGMNLPLYESMPEDLQKILEEVSAEVTDIYGQKIIDAYDTSKEKLQAGIDGYKVSFHTISDEDREAWKKETDFYYEKWLANMEERGVDGQAIMDGILEIRAKYRKEVEEQGYPWRR